jgi:hypothetical protein
MNKADDILIFHDKDHSEWTFVSAVSEDGKYLYMHIVKDTGKVYRLLFITNHAS